MGEDRWRQSSCKVLRILVVDGAGEAAIRAIFTGTLRCRATSRHGKDRNPLHAYFWTPRPSTKSRRHRIGDPTGKRPADSLRRPATRGADIDSDDAGADDLRGRHRPGRPGWSQGRQPPRAGTQRRHIGGIKVSNTPAGGAFGLVSIRVRAEAKPHWANAIFRTSIAMTRGSRQCKACGGVLTCPKLPTRPAGMSMRTTEGTVCRPCVRQ